MALSNTSAVTQLFEAIQYRAPDAANLATFVAQLNAGQLTLQQVQTDIETDPYTVNTVDPVIREYQAAFGRVPDQAGVSFWVNQLASNPALLSNLNVVFANSAEFTARYGVSGATAPGTVALISALYENVLNRAPDPPGLAFWLAQNLDAAQLLQAFAQSPEFINNTQAAIIAFQNLEAAGMPPSPTASLFSLVGGSTFILTTAMDNVNGFTNVIGDLTPYFWNGIGPTLNTGDHISNVDTLTVTDQFGQGFDIIPAGAVVSNVSNVVLETAGNAGGGAYGGSLWDTSGISGVKTSTITSSGGAIDATKGSATTDITVTHGGSDGGVEVLGGQNININTNGDDGVLVGTFNLSPAVVTADL